MYLQCCSMFERKLFWMAKVCFYWSLHFPSPFLLSRCLLRWRQIPVLITYQIFHISWRLIRYRSHYVALDYIGPNEFKPWSDVLPNRLIIFIVSLRMPSTFDVWISGFDSIITACGKNAEATLWINTELLFFSKNRIRIRSIFWVWQ